MLYPDFNELIHLGQKAAHLHLAAGRKTLATASGGYTSPFRGRGMEFHEVREYRTGDDIRNIDWRVTARTNRPHLKVFTEERERTVMLCIDANAAMRFGTRGTFKSVQAARAAALLGWQANGGNDRVGCLVFGDIEGGLQYFTPTRSRSALWKTLKLLSRHATGEHPAGFSLEDTLKYLDRITPTGALVFVISDFLRLTESAEKTLSNLHRRCDVLLVSVNDPADREIPPMETVIFSDQGGRRRMVNTDSSSGRAAYTESWLKNREMLEDIRRRQGIGLIQLHTEHDVYSELLPGLRRVNFGRTAA